MKKLNFLGIGQIKPIDSGGLENKLHILSEKNARRERGEAAKVTREMLHLHENKQESLTLENAWDIIYASFYYSRADPFLQIMILEYFRRKYNLPQDFEVNSPTLLSIEKGEQFRRSAIHKGLGGGSTANLYVDFVPFLSGDLDGINKYLNAGNDPQIGSSINSSKLKQIYALDEEKLKDEVVDYIIRLDNSWKARGSKRSHFEKILYSINNDAGVFGGEYYKKMFEDMKESFKKRESGQI